MFRRGRIRDKCDVRSRDKRPKERATFLDTFDESHRDCLHMRSNYCNLTGLYYRLDNDIRALPRYILDVKTLARLSDSTMRSCAYVTKGETF